jgi:aspartyl-tRNA(Asn)/glutamyl-tRNA(Gln) amidotransferase subunit A
VQDDLCWLSATDAAARIREGVLSPIAYTEAILARVDALQPRLNCFATVVADRARAAAHAAEAAVQKGAKLGPLHGVPVHIKDLFDTAGITTAHGSAVHATNVPARDNILVARLKAAGAIVMGKTTTPEFGHKGITDSPVYGITRNPWNTDCAAGGSSGGAASAVASGQGPLGLGTDGAGSIRIPASTCGVVGHKPTLGLVPFEQTGDAFANYGYAGPLARTVADAALMTRVLAGPSDSDPWTVQHPPLSIDTQWPAQRLEGLRVGCISRMANLAVDRDVADATARMADLLTLQGAHVEECVEAIDWAEREGRILYMGGQAASYGGFEDHWGDRLDPSLRRFMAEGRTYTLIEYRQAQFARTRLYRAVQQLFDRYDVLLTPTLPTASLPADFRVGLDSITIEGTKTQSTRIGWSACVYPFNLTGHPALTIPSGFDSHGIPIGVQLVGRWWADNELFRIAAQLERLSPWHARRPPCV